MSGLNCWEFKKRGREPGGAKAGELGICQSAKETRVDGMNNGKNGGRICWAIAGTLCGGKVQGSYAQKFLNCMACDFYKQVIHEEHGNLADFANVLEKLK
jgi:hypothetical protein